MRIVIQRVQRAKVTVDDKIIGQCGLGYLLLVGFTLTDNEEVIRKMAQKVIHLRIFEDEEGKMNRSLSDVKGEILSVSQFTLYANCKEGRRPSFVEAMRPQAANMAYECFNNELRNNGFKVETGQFQAAMAVELVNDGPVTILLDSKQLGFDK